MSFEVDEGHLEQAAARLMQLHWGVPSAKRYVAEHVDLNGLGDSGIFVSAIGALDRARQAATESLDQLQRITRSTSWEIRATATTYRATDDATDQRLDAASTDGDRRDGPR